MPAAKALISRYLLAFCGFLALSTGLFYVLFPVYGKLVLVLTGIALDPFTVTDVSLLDLKGRGIALIYPGYRTPVMFQYDLFSITLNLIFAPALVLATLVFVSLRRALIGTVIAIAVMLLLHTFHVSVMILHFLTQSPVPHPLISPALSPGLADWFHRSYGFADKMGYTLFPFIAWIVVCYRDIARLLDTRAERRAEAPESDTRA